MSFLHWEAEGIRECAWCIVGLIVVSGCAIGFDHLMWVRIGIVVCQFLAAVFAVVIVVRSQRILDGSHDQVLASQNGRF